MEEIVRKPDRATQLKKMLYIERPDATAIPAPHQKGAGGSMVYPFKHYECQTSLGRVEFQVPYSDMGEKAFGDVEPARLLIRWMVIEKEEEK